LTNRPTRKAGHFWIDKDFSDDSYDGIAIIEMKPDKDKAHNFIHLIEYSAYTQVCMEAQRLTIQMRDQQKLEGEVVRLREDLKDTQEVYALSVKKENKLVEVLGWARDALKLGKRYFTGLNVSSELYTLKQAKIDREQFEKDSCEVLETINKTLEKDGKV